MRGSVVTAGLAAVAAAVLASSCGSSSSSASSSSPRSAIGKITVRSTVSLRPQVTNGGVIGTGHFTISGAITDAGADTDYRIVKGTKELFRRVVVGKNGTITFLITRPTTAQPTALRHWTITSATGTYKGLHGSGEQTVDDTTGSPALFVLTGTVSQ